MLTNQELRDVVTAARAKYGDLPEHEQAVAIGRAVQDETLSDLMKSAQGLLDPKDPVVVDARMRFFDFDKQGALGTNVLMLYLRAEKLVVKGLTLESSGRPPQQRR